MNRISGSRAKRLKLAERLNQKRGQEPEYEQLRRKKVDETGVDPELEYIWKRVLGD